MATRFAFWRKIEEDALAEKHAQPGLLSDFILGSQDGLVNVLGVILGVAVASRNLSDPITIILAPVEKTQAQKSAILVGIAAVLGSLVPLIPFIVIGKDILLGVVVSLIVSTITLFLIGWWKARTTIGRPTRSGVQMAIIGIASAVAGFGIAFLVSGGRGA